MIILILYIISIIFLFIIIKRIIKVNERLIEIESWCKTPLELIMFNKIKSNYISIIFRFKPMYIPLFIEDYLNVDQQNILISSFDYNKFIIQLLFYCKITYVRDRKNFINHGMCFYIYGNSFLRNLGLNDVECILFIDTYLPEFKQLNINNCQKYDFWWPIEDFDSRAKAFDKLIGIYMRKYYKT